ncbi:GSCFA domain-containing protein [Celeribacter persicus]|uniref:GSCFA family protein n=1 Tax=Celeribacter persicus TaxID=1651082 RepID=A0A2T5HK41_9RHOB|nr:GSCFA domain-containing protein [Celeribacter persicus]PTQ71948.1 GSCFA family protein [Celeribacter persicus]
MSHPYDNIPSQSFWRSGVVETDRQSWPGIYRPKVRITRDTAVATAGSCFAQHIGNYLTLSGVNVLDAEPRPKGMSEELARRYDYGIYSARYGNIYTARQMRELLEDAMAGQVYRRLFWARGNRWFDALRPGVEPEGCESREEAIELRREHLMKVVSLAQTTDVFVFTLGLTEGWIHSGVKRTMAMAPGVIAGAYRPRRHTFRNFTYDEIIADLAEILRLLRILNKNIRLLLTVSPVPLTATASGQHVLAATTHSKSILRAAAGDFAAAHKVVDYFPSYELVTTWANTDPVFAANLRSVRPETVERVMEVFLTAQGLLDPVELNAPEEVFDQIGEDDDVVCEEALLEAFRK